MSFDFQIAKVLKPRGLKGELKVEFYTSDVTRLLKLKRVMISGKIMGVERITADGGLFGYIKLAGVDSVEDAELLRGALICVERSALPPLKNGEHYIRDIVGISVYSDGELIGTLSDVLQYGSADVYVVRSAEGSLSFPALKDVIKSVDVEGGKMMLDGAILSRIVVYN